MSTENKIKSPKGDRKSGVTSPKVKTKNGLKNTIVNNRPLRLRIVLVGDEQTGKSCLIKRYCEKRFVSKYLPTIGIDYGATKIFVDKREVGIHIFDTSGNPLFYDVRNEFYRDAHGILMVFDSTDKTTFDSMSRWLTEVSTELKFSSDPLERGLRPVIVICANKTDLRPNYNIDADNLVDDFEAKLWADVHGFSYCETSAMTGNGVGDMFHTFFSQIVKQQNQLDRAGSLPKTPASARRIQPLNSNGANRRSMHAMSPPPNSAPEDEPKPNAQQMPSDEQRAVIERLGRGKNAWQQLGLEPGATKDEVNKAYRKLAVLLHPDKTGVRGADDAFKLLGLARKTILSSFSS